MLGWPTLVQGISRLGHTYTSKVVGFGCQEKNGYLPYK
jgi:hypothetical protein